MHPTPAGDGQKLRMQLFSRVVAIRTAVVAFETCHSDGVSPAGSKVQAVTIARTRAPWCQPIGQMVVPSLPFDWLVEKMLRWCPPPCRSSTYSLSLIVVAAERSSTTTAILVSSGLTEKKPTVVGPP